MTLTEVAHWIVLNLIGYLPKLSVVLESKSLKMYSDLSTNQVTAALATKNFAM